MKILMALMVLSGFCFKSSGIVYKNKAHDPGRKYDQSYDNSTGKYEGRSKYFLENLWDYPWGVCFPKGKHNFQQKHLTWTGVAMQKWNKNQKVFLKVRDAGNLSLKELNSYVDFEGIDVLLNWDFAVKKIKGYDYMTRRFFVDFPDPDKKPLFIWSCDKDKYNLVYPSFGPVPENVLAYHRPKNPLFSDFYGNIVMSNREKWKEEHFINVMIHELGHALGIPHLNPDETEIMASNGFFCETGGKDKICNITFEDFIAFLESYPEHIKTRKDLLREKSVPGILYSVGNEMVIKPLVCLGKSHFPKELPLIFMPQNFVKCLFLKRRS